MIILIMLIAVFTLKQKNIYPLMNTGKKGTGALTGKELRTCATAGCFNATYRTFRYCSYCLSKKYIKKSQERKKQYPKKEKPDGTKTLLEFYWELWYERNHVSWLSGLPLYQFDLSCFCHVLAKASNRYYKFKFYKKNIVLLTQREHYLFDMGTVSSRATYQKENPSCDWERLFALKAELLDEYQNL